MEASSHPSGDYGVEAAGLRPLDAEAIIEIGYLALAADGALTTVELDAFRRVASRLAPSRWADLGPGQLEARFEAFAEAAARTSLETRLSELAAQLDDATTRRQAYRIASALTLCDLASNDREQHFDALLAQALGLSEGEADALARDAYASIRFR